MLGRLLSHLTYANVVSTICLFVVLSGTAYAAVTVPFNTGPKSCSSQRSQLVPPLGMPALILGRSSDLAVCRMYTMAFGTPTWLPAFASSRPGVMTRPFKWVTAPPALLQSGMALHSAQAVPPPVTHFVGLSTPPMQTWLAVQASPSLPQSMTLLHLSMV